MTEVATYVIETTDRRFELQDMVPIGSAAFELNVKVAGKHKRLYAQSDLRRQYYRWAVASFALWFVMMFCLFSLVRSLNR
jgi:hypothetical protein